MLVVVVIIIYSFIHYFKNGSIHFFLILIHLTVVNSDRLISQNNSRREYEETVAQLEELRKTHLECDNKFSELKKSQESEKKLILKLKAQVKNYRNEINSKKVIYSVSSFFSYYLYWYICI